MKNSLCFGSDIDSFKAVQKTQNEDRGVGRPSPVENFPTENSYELKVAPSVALDDSADTEMSVRPVALLPDLPSLWYFPG